jgi:site-specific DNA-methyltransferase (adenine-specific)
MSGMKNLLNKIHFADNMDVMAQLPDDSIDLTVTSPPYDGLRTYNGYSFDFESISKALYRITKGGGVVVWVVGDQTVNGSETGTSFKQALYFKKIGFNIHDTMIYKSAKPPLTHNRYEQCFEYMFIISKGKPKTFNPSVEKKIYNDNRDNKSFQRNKDDSRSFGFCSDNKNKIKNNIWEYSTGSHASKDKIAFQHPAIFPEALASDHIKSWSNENDIVFDPFSGSGTTAKMAILLNRNFIACEISEEYVALSRQRIQPYIDQGRLF